LMNGTTHFYEGWPHVFGLSSDAFSGPGLHGRKAFDEVEAGTIGNESDATSASTSGGADVTPVLKMQDVDKVSEPRHVTDPGQLMDAGAKAPLLRVSESESSKADFDLGDIDRDASGLPIAAVVMRRVRAHLPPQTTRVVGVTQGAAFKSEQPAPSLEEKSPASENSYGHPAWLSHCALIYLDVGTNIGVQVRKLFEPERYPRAQVLPIFDEIFGDPKDRTQASSSSGICALGLEPNPVHQGHLQKLQENYTAMGWNVHFYQFAAWKDDGNMMFDEATEPATNDWAAHIGPKDTDPVSPWVSVRTINLAEFVKSLPLHSVKLMKVDIEGAEYETVFNMLQKKALCQGTVDEAFFESHAWGDVTNWQDDRTFAALQKHIAAADCGLGGKPTKVTDLDDETFKNDDPQAEWKAAEAKAIQIEVLTAMREKGIMFVIVILASLIVFYFGYQKYAGGSLLDKASFNLGRTKASEATQDAK